MRARSPVVLCTSMIREPLESDGAMDRPIRTSCDHVPERSARSERDACPYSIIVCTHNRADLLRNCLQATIQEMRSSEVSGELIVVDNASTDHTKTAVDALAGEVGDAVRLTYVFESEPNLSIARNRGIDEAAGSVLVFLDDDAFPAPDWLSSCLKAFATNPTVLGVGGEVAPRLGAAAPDWFREPLTAIYTIMDLGGTEVRPFSPQSHPVGANMAFRRSVFETRRFSSRLGRSRLDLIGGEESEICASIRRAGGALLYVPGMKVEHFIHPERLTEQWVLDRYFFEGISRARMPFGWRVHAVSVAKQIVKLTLLMLMRPFLRTHFQRLLWGCRIRWSIGYASELTGVTRFRR
jgi:glycosyltransferase involved in cell wall biosynthesis